jgi:hypothetical protein
MNISSPEFMENFKKNYYDQNKKNTFFKKAQKIDCVKELISSPEFDLNIALKNTIYVLNDTNKLFLNYEIFKHFGHPENYEQIVNYILSLILLCISKFSSFEMHININTFTISAAERYKDIIKLFMMKCLSNNTQFSKLLALMKLYNTPLMMNEISKLLKPFVDPIIINKIQMYNKNETPIEYNLFLKN